ncbi:hypothetical protein D3C73_1392370 [compost metagenome]
MALQARGSEIMQKDLLIQQRRPVIGNRLRRNHLLHEGIAADYSANTQARSDIFAEAAEVNDPAFRII